MIKRYYLLKNIVEDSIKSWDKIIAMLLILSLCVLRGMPRSLPIYITDAGFGVQTTLARLTDIYADYENIQSEGDWEVSDFGFEETKIPGTADADGNLDVEYCITGFSKIGKKKLKKKKKLILPNIGANGKIPTWVGEGAFSDMEIEELEIPSNYTHIQFRAFKNCKIKKLILHEGILFVNKFAFMDNAIEEVSFPSTLKYTAEGAFKNNKLRRVEFPEKVESIGVESFMNNQLEEIDFKGKLKHILDRAFANNQLTVIEIPKSLRNLAEGIPGIYASAFDQNPGIQNPKNPKETKVILYTPKKNNPFGLKNQGNYIIDPDWEG